MKNFMRHIKDWAKAFLWAFIAAWIVRSFLIQGAFIPTQSMERTLFPGDFIFINKLSYGARTPITPLAAPFMHQYMPFSNSIPAYLDWISLPYLRLPGFSEIKRNDVIVFNYPLDVERPIDKRTFYVKRCIGLPGDTLQIIEKQLIINGDTLPKNPEFQFVRKVKATAALQQEWLDSLGINEGGLVSNMLDYEFPLTDSLVNVFEAHPSIHAIQTKSEKSADYQAYIFPHSRLYPFNNDFWGPVVIPKKDASIQLNDSNIVLYERIIRDYENNELRITGGNIYINGIQTSSYTFKYNYYFGMGDNRDFSADSRSWGFIPETHIIGKAWITFFSYKQENGGNHGIRWNRVFKSIE
jgi:signal peptidase I